MILMVEDNESYASVFRRMRTRMGFLRPLMVLGSGEAAIQYLAGEGVYANREAYPMPSVIVLDLYIPKVNGLEVLRWMRDNGITVPCVVVTGSRSPIDVDWTLYFQPRALFLKNEDHMQDLIEYVETVAGGSRGLPSA